MGNKEDGTKHFKFAEKILLAGLLKNAPASAPQGGATRRQADAS